MLARLAFALRRLDEDKETMMDSGTNPTQGGVNLTLLLASMQASVQALNNLNQTLANVFPKQTGTSASATGGSATLPANPVGFTVITLSNGTSVKVPYYS